MPATGADDRHAGVHQRQRRAADRCHGARTVRFQNVADDAHGVGERFVVGNHGRNGAFGQRAVSDFATARAAHEAHFADAERREVVVQHEALRGFRRIQQLNALLVVLGAERRRHQRLRFAAREQRRSVGARQHAHFDIRSCGPRRTCGHPDGGASFSISSRKMRSFSASNSFLASAFCSSGQRLDRLLLGRRRCASSFRASRTSGCSSRPSVRR